MDIIFKIIAVGLITCLATMILKPIRSDFAVVVGIAGGIIIIFLIVGYLTGIIDIFKSIISSTGLDASLYKLLLKIIGVAYLLEFTSSICSDTGNSSLGDKILLGGKVVLMVMALPIVVNILEIITGLLPK